MKLPTQNASEEESHNTHRRTRSAQTRSLRTIELKSTKKSIEYVLNRGALEPGPGDGSRDGLSEDYHGPCPCSRVEDIVDGDENRLNLKLWEVSGAAKNTHVVSAA